MTASDLILHLSLFAVSKGKGDSLICLALLDTDVIKWCDNIMVFFVRGRGYIWGAP